VRFYRHESEKEWAFTAEAVRRLNRAGVRVAVALVQDRQAVLRQDLWRAFLETVLAGVAGSVDRVEIGHAVNRVKWGIWSLAEHRRLLETAAGVAARSRRGVHGPAAIDFEYPFLMAALKRSRRPAVRRAVAPPVRGPPRRAGEPQNGFSALEVRAGARYRSLGSCCEDRLVVSEVNWPIKGTGVYSPVGSPRVSRPPFQ